MTDRTVRHFDAFAGYGGFRLGMERAGLTVDTVGFSEIAQSAIGVYKYHWPDTKNYGDISQINWSEVPDFDVLTGGSPCQDFSIAGRRQGLAGGRSALAWHFVRAIEEKNPPYFVWENVKGTLSSNGGWDFANLLMAFSDAGYALWWQVLNAKDFGVPQNRERVIVVGARSGPPSEVFFEAGNGGEDTPAGDGTTLTYWKNSKEKWVREVRQETLALKTQTDYVRQTLIESRIRVLNGKQPQSTRVYDPAGIAPTINSGAGGLGTKAGIYDVSTETEVRLRYLTPIERERCMGLPDDWTRYDEARLELRDGQRFELCGNGIVIPMVEAIFRGIVFNEDRG